uniref:Putative mitochondrial ribosome-associated gtpase 1 n=1 Tax=Ixodes ricinus TaxID=34613 RepID=A0A131XS27_IXORI
MLTAIKPHLLLLNKRDLADPDVEHHVVQQLQAQGVRNVLHIRSSDPTENINKIVPTVANMIRNSERFNRREEYDYNIMVIGIPNVGKSSLINSLRRNHLGRKGKATKVGAKAGVTMSVLERIKISQEPSMYLLDTPGVLCPTVKDPVVALQLALCSCMPDHLVGVTLIADYLLYWLNQNNNYSYVDYLGLDGPCDDIRLVLYQAAMAAGSTMKRRTHEGWSVRPNLDAAAQQFIRGFRQGLLGRVVFDAPTW